MNKKKQIKSHCQSTWKWFLSALFPQTCILCKKEGALLCTEHHRFPPAPINKVSFKYVDDIKACTSYQDKKTKKLIENCKYFGDKEAAQYMAQEIKKKMKKNEVIIPVPLHWTRKFWRGFNQSEQIAKGISNCTIRTDLKRIKKTAQQAKLGKKQREKNIKNAFEWKSKEPPPKKVTLLDDVVASGATLDECARTLKRAGCKEVQALVFARGGK